MNSNSGWLIYDGDCGFCTTAANWIAGRWPVQSGIRVIPWQLVNREVIGNSQLTLEDLKRSAWWIEGDRYEDGPRAVGRALVEAGGALALLGRSILAPPLSWIAPFGYEIVARNRHRLPGGTATCRM